MPDESEILKIHRGFGNKLQEAAGIYVFGDRRIGARLACKAVIDFIKESGGDAQLAFPFATMLKGFEDLDRGVEPAIFSRRPKEQKRPRDSEFAYVKRLTAAILEILMELSSAEREQRGIPQGEKLIAGYVARSAKKWITFSHTSLTATTVMTFRKAEKSLSSTGRKPFDMICNGLRNEPDTIARLLGILANGPPGIPKS